MKILNVKKLQLIILFTLLLQLISIQGTSSNFPTSPELYQVKPQATSTAVHHDGIISLNEYNFQTTINAGIGFNLYYTINQSTIYFAFEATANGWISVGFGSSTKMQGSDILIGYVDSSNIAHMADNWGNSPTTHIQDDTSYDILSYGGSQSGGKTILEFSRFLNTNDIRDNVILTGSSMTLIWAISNFDDFTSYHSSRGFSAITFQTTTPSVPRSIITNPGDSYVELQWLAPLSNGGSPITQYNIKRSDIQGGPYTTLSTTDTPFYNDSAVINNQNYYYVISAQNVNGEGANSNEIFAYASTALTPPLNFIVSSNVGKIVLNWTVPLSNGGSPITYYNIYRSGISEGSYELLGSSSTLSYIDDSIINGLNYYYIVRAVNQLVEGFASIEVIGSPIGIPSSPEKIFATPSSNNITLSWLSPITNGGLEIQNYSIYRSDTQFGNFQFIESNSSVRGYTDLSVINLQTYYYTVTAINSAGESSFDQIIKIKVAQIPYAVSGMNFTTGYNQITIRWDIPFDNGFGITHYNIYRSSSIDETYFLIQTSPISNFTDLSVTNSEQFYYKISAVNNQGEGVLSEPISITPGTIPDYPLNFRAIPMNGRITLTWNEPDLNGGFLIAKYNLYRKSSEEAIFRLIFGNNSLNYIDVNVTNNLRYEYQLSAVNSLGESLKVNVSDIIPSFSPTKPTDVSIAYIDEKVVINWNMPAEETTYPVIGYRIYRAFNLSSSFTLLGENSSVLSFTDLTTIRGKNTYYALSAINQMGEGDFSDIVSILPSTKPTPVLNLVGLSGNKRVSLLWSPSISDGGSNVIGYHIYRATKETDHLDFKVIANTTDTQYQDLDLKNNLEYQYYVTAENIVGESDISNKVSSIPKSNGNSENNIDPSLNDNGIAIDQILLTLSLFVSIGLIASTIKFLKKNRPNSTNQLSQNRSDQTIGFTRMINGHRDWEA